MASSSLEKRVAQLETQVAELQSELNSTSRKNGKDWRRTIGMFTDDIGPLPTNRIHAVGLNLGVGLLGFGFARFGAEALFTLVSGLGMVGLAILGFLPLTSKLLYTRLHMNLGEEMGIRALLCHAIDESAKQFYQHHGFIESPIDPLTLMLNIARLSRAP